MANESKKFALFACCLMTMQALRLVISTAGFCVVRFHIDCELFNIFISRLVNAVMMSSLVGNWLGDLIVFAASGQIKMIALAAANWAELLCFCSAIVCLVHSELGHLTGFYWSMVGAYFWWKVGEAPCISIAVNEADWYFAGFTLSGVWAACLKGLVMLCVVEEKGIHSDVLGDVNVKVVGTVSVIGARSIKTTVDYRAAKWLYIITIVLTFFMCLVWELAAWVKTEVAPENEGFTRDSIVDELKEAAKTKPDGKPTADSGNNKLAMDLKALADGHAVDVEPTSTTDVTLSFSTATVETNGDGINAAGSGNDQITITVKTVTAANASTTPKLADGTKTQAVEEKVKKKLNGLITRGDIESVTLEKAALTTGSNNTITVTATIANGDGTRGYIGEALKNMAASTLKNAIQGLGTGQTVDTTAGSPNTKTLNFESSQVAGDDVKASGPNQITIKVTGVSNAGGQGTGEIKQGSNTGKVTDELKEKLEGLIAPGWAMKVELTGNVTGSDVTITVTTGTGGWITGSSANTILAMTGITTGAVFAVPGALALAWLGKWCKSGLKWLIIAGAILGFGGGAGTVMVAGGGEGTMTAKAEMWVPFFKWGLGDWSDPALKMAALIGLRKGTLVGAIVGLIIGAIVDRTSKGDGGRSQLWFAAIEAGRHSELLSASTRKTAMWRGTAAGAFFGSFFGLWSGEIYNGYKTWKSTGFLHDDGGGNDKRDEGAVVCGFFIVVLGLGTVYSIYPGMAPCSITQFKYFNIIDIWILILSSIAPIVIMVVDLAELDWRLAKTILTKVRDANARWRMWGAIGVAVVMTVATNICEIIVLNVMQHPFSKTAQEVTTSGWRACTLTILMVSFQLTSTGIGFACVAAGSGFNDGVYNALSTLVLWTVECCGVLGEGYLTELKKYEPGKWPTQGMGKGDAFDWWCGKAISNAWQIWCCIGTTDLRRDIMLCRQ